MPQVLLEGYTAEEVLALPSELLDSLALSDEPLIFKAGSARMLGKFSVAGDTLVLELAQIDGGGEGALPTLASVAQRYAKRESLSYVEWRVHAIHCARPNLKLRRVLERKGFMVRDVAGVGECYWLRVPVKPNPARSRDAESDC